MADGRAALRADGFHRLTPFLSLHFEAKRLALAMTIWMFYDLIITLPQNIGYIRPETWTLGRSLFVLNRFLVPILMLLNAVSLMIPEPSNACDLLIDTKHSLPYSCSFVPWLMTLGNWLVTVCLGALLLARVHALWMQRWILVALIAFFVLVFCGNFVFLAFVASKSVGLPNPFPRPFTGCIWFPMSRFLWVTFVTSGSFETICVILTAWKTWKPQNKKESPTLYLLFHDGILYYMCIISLKAFTLVSAFFPSTRAFASSNNDEHALLSDPYPAAALRPTARQSNAGVRFSAVWIDCRAD
ncbi:SubName: Full=Uncharacterized protein {ECO:0000313/EMBL:CCA66878.1} [Serendipita indica DSM 11827]|nr:SubName: Full=Uncharacterized protein {ECO:0000313/EMBL:CCA66878.1} [Serendipita indica DSM 11827]